MINKNFIGKCLLFLGLVGSSFYMSNEVKASVRGGEGIREIPNSFSEQSGENQLNKYTFKWECRVGNEGWTSVEAGKTYSKDSKVKFSLMVEYPDGDTKFLVMRIGIGCQDVRFEQACFVAEDTGEGGLVAATKEVLREIKKELQETDAVTCECIDLAFQRGMTYDDARKWIGFPAVNPDSVRMKQKLMLRVARECGYQGGFEARWTLGKGGGVTWTMGPKNLMEREEPKGLYGWYLDRDELNILVYRLWPDMVVGKR